MYQAAKKGAGAYDTFAALSNTAEKEAKQKVETIVVSSNLLSTLATKMGNKAPEFWTALASNDVGKLAKLTKPFRNDQDLMAQVDAFQAGVRQQIYGSAFTETEAKLAKEWLATGSDQANQIWVKLLGQQKINKARLDALQSSGYSQEEIDRNLERAGYKTNITPPKQNDSRSPLSNFDQ